MGGKIMFIRKWQRRFVDYPTDLAKFGIMQLSIAGRSQSLKKETAASDDNFLMEDVGLGFFLRSTARRPTSATAALMKDFALSCW